MIEGGSLLETLDADPHGARVLAALAHHHGNARRGGRRAPLRQGPLPVVLTGDTVVDLADGRPPQRIDVRSALPVGELTDELRRRLRGHVTAARVHDVIELRQAEPGRLRMRLAPLWDTSPPSRLSDPVLTVRAVQLNLDGSLDGPSADLASRKLSSSIRRPSSAAPKPCSSRPVWRCARGGPARPPP